MMHLFNQNSYWHETEALPEEAPISIESAIEPATPLNISNQQLEDWSHRLQSMAYEAGDEHLEALESDLLDLRDEIIFELHQRI